MFVDINWHFLYLFASQFENARNAYCKIKISFIGMRVIGVTKLINVLFCLHLDIMEFSAFKLHSINTTVNIAKH